MDHQLTIRILNMELPPKYMPLMLAVKNVCIDDCFLLLFIFNGLLLAEVITSSRNSLSF